jgi:hypothetical protein
MRRNLGKTKIAQRNFGYAGVPQSRPFAGQDRQAKTTENTNSHKGARASLSMV